MQPSQPQDRRAGKRIGILTYHRSVNDGSVMQTYSLYHLLCRECPDATIEIIDYSPWSLRKRHFRLGCYNFRPPFLNPRYLWSYLRQMAFLRRQCRFSRGRLVSDDLATIQKFIFGQGYDAIVVGSDNLWEVGGAPPPPNAYFCPAPDVPTFAFAPSADPAPASSSRWSDPASGLRGALEKFRILTVRDAGTREFLADVGIAPNRIGFLPDPTLLWDFSDKVAQSGALHEDGRPLAALAASPELARPIRQFLAEAGYSVMSLMGARRLANVSAPPLLSGIGQRLALYRSFDLTITDRFHMSIFALKLGRGPVIFLEDTARWPRAQSKGRDLFKRLGLESMVWRIGEDEASQERLGTLIAGWPELAADLPERLAALRTEAERTGYSGIVPALRSIASPSTAAIH